MKNRKAGFTLIELSIVIVIIALIIGGVLVGRDLIQAAQLRKVNTAVEQFRTAAITFKGKYGTIPGDIPTVKAQQFGFSNCTGWPCGTMLGNGQLDDTNSGPGALKGGSGEAMLFWKQLTQAGLLSSSVDSTAPLAADGTPSPVPATATESFRYTPVSPIKGGAFYLDRATTFYSGTTIMLDNISSLSGVTNEWVHSALLSPLQAYSIDTKFDDGDPMSGLIISFDNANADPTSPAVGLRVPALSSVASGPGCRILSHQYNTGGSGANLIACGLFFIVREF